MAVDIVDIEKIIRLTGAEDSSGLRMALGRVLVSTYHMGYDRACVDLESAYQSARAELLNETTPKG